jgi:alpha-tubulin suppressor-like RCC1 family protein
VGTLGTCDDAPFVQMAASWDGVYALRSTGGSAAWGRGTQGELGNGGAVNSLEPTEGPRGFVEIDAGNTFACARNAAGRVFCFGTGSSGRLGHGLTDTGIRTSPVQAVGITSAVGVAAGFTHACAIEMGGSLLCWGDNGRGQLGRGTTGGTSSTPTATSITDAIQVYGGLRFTCVLRPNPSGGNRVTCFGENEDGELGRGFVSASEDDTEVNVMGLPSDVVSFGRGASGAFTCVRTSGGAVYCWGFSSLSAVGQGSSSPVANRIQGPSGPIADAVQLATGVDTACALRPGAGPGLYSPWCWGDDRAAGQGVTVPDSPTARQVLDTTMMPIMDATYLAVGQGWGCVSRSDQTVWCWGADGFGVQGNGAGNAVQQLAQRVLNIGP